jgi:transcriptional regulator GlxA family with amidase domain
VFGRIAHDAGAKAMFAHNRLPPLRDLSGLTARARNAIGRTEILEEIGFELAGTALTLSGRARRGPSPTRHHGRLTEILRYMAAHSAAPHKLTGLAGMARMSPYHFLRTFRLVTGVTPHQWLLRTRLRDAAGRLASTRTPVTNVALDVGFDDLSNFTRSFRAEFGASPRQYRLAA